MADSMFRLEPMNKVGPRRSLVRASSEESLADTGQGGKVNDDKLEDLEAEDGAGSGSDNDDDDQGGDDLISTQLNNGFITDDDDNSDDEKSGLHQLARIGDVPNLLGLLNKESERAKVNDLDENGMGPIHYAARYNHLNVVQALIDSGNANAGLRDEAGATALHYNARRQPRDDENPQETTELIYMLVNQTKVNVINHFGSTPLHLAAMRGNIPALEAILQFPDVNIEARDHNGNTPLHEAVYYNHANIIKLLLSANADVNALDRHMRLPLHKAAMGEDNARTLAVLLGAVDKKLLRENVNKEDGDKNSPLHLAVDARNKAAVRILLKNGADVQAVCRPTSTSSTPLHLAAITGELDVIEMLLLAGARVLARDARRATPLHSAVEYQNEKAVKLLLTKSRTPILGSRDIYHKTPLLRASSHPNHRIVQALLTAGSNILATDRKDHTALHIAAEKNQLPVVQVLMKHVSEPSRVKQKAAFLKAVDQSHQTALHLASMHGFTDITLALVENGAELDVTDDNEDTPILLAAKYGRSEMIDIFLEKTKGRMLNDTDEFLNTALHLAAAGGYLDIVASLVEAGAPKDVWNDKNQTPMDRAAAKGHAAVVNYFLKENVSPNPVDKKKMPPLLTAAMNGHDDVVSLLIESGADMFAVDLYGRNCMELALVNNHRDVLEAIVKSSRWRLALLHKRDRPQEPRMTPFRLLIIKYPDIALMVLNNSIGESSDEVKNWEEDFWLQLDYTFLDDTYFDYKLRTVKKMENTYKKDAPECYDECNVYGSGVPYTTDKIWAMKNHPLNIIIEKRRDDLLSHPLVLSLARRKWNVTRPLYLLYLVFYVMFVFFISALMLEATAPFNIDDATCDQPDAQSVRTTFEKVCTYIVIVLGTLGCISELIQVLAEGWMYAESPLNLLDWFSFISAIAISADIRPCGARTSWQWQLGAFSLFSTWMNMFLLLRRFPFVGIYVVMVTEILKTFGKAFTAFFLFIVAFGLCFYVLLANMEPFATPSLAFIKTWVMMTGEMDYGDIFFAEDDVVHYPLVTYAIFVIFLVVLSIVLTNLLVGLAVDDVGELQRHAKLTKLEMQIEAALTVELAMPLALRKYFQFSVCRQTFYPNQQVNVIMKGMTSFLDGPILRMDKILAKAKSLETEPNDLQELNDRMSKYVRSSQARMRDLTEKLENIEEMLDQIVSQPNSRASGRRRRLRRTTPYTPMSTTHL